MIVIYWWFFNGMQFPGKKEAKILQIAIRMCWKQIKEGGGNFLAPNSNLARLVYFFSHQGPAVPFACLDLCRPDTCAKETDPNSRNSSARGTQIKGDFPGEHFRSQMQNSSFCLHSSSFDLFLSHFQPMH